MKTETICGKEVLRVDEIGGSCRAHHKNKRIDCVFFDSQCRVDGKDLCDSKPITFIRPDQLNDYLAIKLVS